MRIKLTRNWPKADYIIGRLFLDGQFFSNSMEPPWRDNAKNTAIPPGIYEVMLSYSPKFKRILPLVLNVSGRSGILFHRGSLPKDTRGCILTGYNTAKGMLTSSADTEARLVKLIKEAKGRGEIVTLEVV